MNRRFKSDHEAAPPPIFPSFTFALAFAALALFVLASSPSRAIAVPLAAERVAMNLNYPVFATSLPNDNRLFILEQRGVIKILNLSNNHVLSTPFLDIQPLVFDPSQYDERGLLGLAFHPNYASNGYLYVMYNNNDWNTVIARYQVSSNPNRVIASSAFIIMTINQPGPNHKGGTIAFGPDGYLYIGMGDGGGEGDPQNFAQRDDSLLGKMLRIDVDGGVPYAIPPDNPFAGPGLPLDEIWAKGYRNPYRWSFDRQTGDMFIGDVGQAMWEEIDYQPAASPGGENYGWHIMEGNHCYEPPEGCDPDSLVPPIHEYQHIFHCAVIGGYVYRGLDIPDLQGTYLFADYCTAAIWSFRYVNGQVTEFRDRTAELSPDGEIQLISSFGQDSRGELYIIARGTPTTGEVFRIVQGAVNSADPGEASAPPSGLRLLSANPNPFSGSTQVSVAVAHRPQRLRAAVYTTGGRLVEELAPTLERSNVIGLTWNGRDARGMTCPSGVYILRVEADGGSVHSRLVLIH